VNGPFVEENKESAPVHTKFLPYRGRAKERCLRGGSKEGMRGCGMDWGGSVGYRELKRIERRILL